MEETKKLKLYKKWWFWVIIVVIISILILLNIKNNNIQKNNTITTTNIETGNKKTDIKKLKENIQIEKIGIAIDGDFVFKVNNNNNQSIFLDSISIVFKDMNGNFVKKAYCTNSFFGIGANSETVLCSSGYEEDFTQYPNYEFEFELSSKYMSEDVIVDNFELIANNTGEQIAVQINNKNDFEIKNINISVVYYKDGEVVGYQEGFEFQTNTKAQGSAYINLDYPEDRKYKKVEFDDFKVYFISAKKI